jgi:Protein of unknown function (DUF2795)
MEVAREIWKFRDDSVATVDLGGFEVEGKDGTIGRVVRTDSSASGGFVVVERGFGFERGRQLLVPAGLVDRVDLQARRVSVGLERGRLEGAPEYESDRPLTEALRTRISDYFGGSERRRTTPASSQSRGASRSRPSAARRRSTARRSGSAGRGRSTSRARSGRSSSRSDEPTKAELYEEAKRLDIEGRSNMTKARLREAVRRRRSRSAGRRSTSKAHPVHVQAFLEGVGYPTDKQKLVNDAKSQGADREVRDTLERLPRRRFKSPTEVSEAIGRLG